MRRSASAIFDMENAAALVVADIVGATVGVVEVVIMIVTLVAMGKK